MTLGNILVIDDEEQLRKLLSRILSLEGFDIIEAGTLRAGLTVLNSKPVDVVLCDVKLPDGNGVEFVKTFTQQFPSMEIILLTAFGNIPDGVQAIKNGAFDYIVKGTDNDRILPLLHQALDRVKIGRQAAIKIDGENSLDFDAIVGNSPLVLQAINLAKKISPTDATVLLLGETGTGKEVFAQAIHRNSRRNGKPFVALNCSAFTRDLLEGELFGHKAGAYTGALKDKSGLIETAGGGTLFLDEIGELNIELQAKLLRVLETRELIRLGDTKVTKVDVRIIAATNRALTKEIEGGRFREDLYYRLNTFTIELPSLRERIDDIRILANHFLQEFCKKEGKGTCYINPAAIKLLESHVWKGNIRELRNVIHRAIILSDGPEVRTEHLPYEIHTHHTGLPSQSLAAIEHQHIQKILQYTTGNKTKAAKVLGIGLATLYRKMEEYGINK